MIETEIYQVLTGSTEVTDLVGARIYHHHLPDNFDITSNGIVFIINKDESQATLDDKDALEQHTMDIIAVDGDTIEVEAIITVLETLLNGYSDNTLRDIESTHIDPTQDAEKDRYIKRITFNIIYNN